MVYEFSQSKGHFDQNLRVIKESDSQALGELLYESYLNTADYDGETEEDSMIEMEATLFGKYGSIISNSSLVAIQDSKIVGAIIISDFESNSPLLTYVMIKPEYKRRGLGEKLIYGAIKSLQEQGHEQLFLYVSEDNTPAVTLYEKIGFEIVHVVSPS